MSAATANRTIINWMKNCTTTPKAYAEPETIEAVQQIVRDSALYPSPLRAIGAALSPSAVHSNDQGSIVAMYRLNACIGIESLKGGDNEQINCLKAEAGTTFADVQQFLHKKGLEMAFSAEIGSATIGGACFSTTKDSCIGPVCPSGGLGDFQSCIMGIDIVGPDGEIQEHRLFANGVLNASFQPLLGSQGTQGIAVCIYIATRKCIPVTTTIHVLSNKGKHLAKTLQTMAQESRAQEGNIFAMLSLTCGVTLVEERLPTTLPSSSSSPSPSCSLAAPLSRVVKAIYEPLKKRAFQRCQPPAALLKAVKLLSGSALVRYTEPHRRGGFRYRLDVPLHERKLTFSYYSFNEPKFVGVVDSALAFTREYERRTGFAPNGFAVYFVTRSGLRDAGPYAGYEGAGTSFSFDPIYHDPNDPRWPAFVHAFSMWARDHGGRPALNQTPEIEKDPQYGALCVSATCVPHPRFTSEWIQAFFDAKKQRLDEDVKGAAPRAEFNAILQQLERSSEDASYLTLRRAIETRLGRPVEVHEKFAITHSCVNAVGLAQ